MPHSNDPLLQTVRSHGKAVIGYCDDVLFDLNLVTMIQ